MIALLGDIHGDHELLAQRQREAALAGAVALIQVGDFGFWPHSMDRFRGLDYELPVYAIDGNHEYFPLLAGIDRTTALAPRLYYAPRGVVLELDGRRIGLLGGAGSIDKAYRTPGRDWFPDEYVTEADVDRFRDAGPVDMLVSHCPPQRTIDRHFDPRGKLMFGVPLDWTDPSAERVERAWRFLGSPPLYCGHMHRAVTDAEDNIRILDIGEMILV